MRDDLYKLWHENAFSVDVDDNYRIRTFTQAAVDAGLPAYVSPPTHAQTLEFLKEHFRWSLTAQLVGGDITKDYPLREVAIFMEEMGLNGDEEDVPPLDDPRWGSVIGQEVLLDVQESDGSDSEV
ncbi:hypothetical protein C8Q76DRAFT_349924 [Earliella scabrosa]|nr:hypothetical protein C8Q76DRAFT_349924 [Earliella scabrosa]